METPMAIDDVYGSWGLLAASAAAARAARYAGMRRYRRSSSLYAEQATFATMDETRCADDLRLQLRARLLRDAPPARPWSVGVE
jgi:hypothetical protein